MPKLTIDGQEIDVVQGTSVLQACEQLGVEVPRFCYHDRLSVPANCRMCLVEIEKTPKPVASCAMPCAEGMVVHTNTPVVHKARKGVMEMLLINHPLDCPICDQGGECDLQDQAMGYGFDRSRFQEMKRAVKDKELGPVVKTVMTRCIHCTRCVRFMEEIAGTPELGGVFRGEHMEISNFENGPLTSELSGNIVDICPVGALTSKPYAFEARPWELQKTESVDVLDAVGSSIRIDTRGNEVLRILPRLNEAVNEEWINDKTRLACDGLKYQRLDTPYIRVEGKLRPATWEEALAVVAAKLKSTEYDRIGAIAGDLVDCESLFALKSLLGSLRVTNMDCRQDGADYDVSARAAYIMNSTIAGIEDADALLLIGTDPRREATLVNARIRKRWRRGGFRVGLVGAYADLTYPFRHVGDGPEALKMLLDDQHEFAKILSAAKNPMLILGAGALARVDGAALHALAREVADKFRMVRQDWNGFNVLQLAASRVGGLDMGFVPGQMGLNTRQMLKAVGENKLDILYLLGADEIELPQTRQTFVIYQGHHGDRGAHFADVVLPGAAYTEKHGIYINTEGRAQLGRPALSPPGEAREDWKIIRALSEQLGKTLPFDTLNQLRAKLIQAFPVLGQIGVTEKAEWKVFGKKGNLASQPFSPVVANFYMTDPITRASPTMAKCTTEILPYSIRDAAE